MWRRGGVFETCASFERGSNKSNDHFIFMYNRFAMVILALIIHYKKVLTKKGGEGEGHYFEFAALNTVTSMPHSTILLIPIKDHMRLISPLIHLNSHDAAKYRPHHFNPQNLSATPVQIKNNTTKNYNKKAPPERNHFNILK